jgi:hypothetical protein
VTLLSHLSLTFSLLCIIGNLQSHFQIIEPLAPAAPSITKSPGLLEVIDHVDDSNGDDEGDDNSQSSRSASVEDVEVIEDRYTVVAWKSGRIMSGKRKSGRIMSGKRKSGRIMRKTLTLTLNYSYIN